MPIAITDECVRAGDRVYAFERFPELLAEFVGRVPATPFVERAGQALVSSDFAQHETVVYVLCVCCWGGNQHDQAGKILAASSPAQIRVALRRAYETLQSAGADGGAQVAALECLTPCPNLKGVSYGSKHLMLMRPDVCGTLDSRVSRLGYYQDPSGYRQWCADCMTVATRLESLGVANPRGRENGRWYAADIDAAMFTTLMGWMA